MSIPDTVQDILTENHRLHKENDRLQAELDDARSDLEFAQSALRDALAERDRLQAQVAQMRFALEAWLALHKYGHIPNHIKRVTETALTATEDYHNPQDVQRIAELESDSQYMCNQLHLLVEAGKSEGRLKYVAPRIAELVAKYSHQGN